MSTAIFNQSNTILILSATMKHGRATHSWRSSVMLDVLENKSLWKWYRFQVLWLIPRGSSKSLDGGGEGKGRKEAAITAVVITTFPVVWDAKNECFLPYKDRDLPRCKAISIYNALVWKSWLLCHSWETFRDLGYCIALNYSKRIICSPPVLSLFQRGSLSNFTCIYGSAPSTEEIKVFILS